ncbi:hypothetical protein [Kushneria aurantia]|uniref:Uncharacterized protein n=1 Tax=Kushneria aurantia TaxID=504092 RepID=A0ABV6G4P8_9GAMM|nr:hypothetical protein [Kushneria aurantia]
MADARTYTSADIARARLGTAHSTGLALEARDAAFAGRHCFLDHANAERLKEYRRRRDGLKEARIPIWRAS